MYKQQRKNSRICPKLEHLTVLLLAEALLYSGGGYPTKDYVPEAMTVTVPKLRVVLELEADMKCTPLVVVRAAAEAHVKDWSSQLHLRGELQLQASYMNGALAAWEPLIEPVVEGENVYRPWELQVRLFRAKAFPISSRLDSLPEGDSARRVSSRKKSTASQPGHPEDSQTSGEETEPEHSMTFIRRPATRSDCGQDGQNKGSRA